MKKVWTLLLSAALLAAAARAHAAEEKPKGAFSPGNFNGTAALTTDYVFRGVSQTSENPAVQGSLNYSHPLGFYLGVWGSNVYHTVSDGGIELDYSGGWTKTFGDFGVDVGGVYYQYPSHGMDPEPNYFETHLGASYKISGGSVEPTFKVYWNWSPDYYAEDGNGNYVNGSVTLALPYSLSVSGEIGYQDVEGDKLTGNGGGLDGKSGYDYWHWRFGVGYTILGFNLDLSYHGTNEEEFLGKDNANDRVVFTLSRTF